jgi:hypothetical protein
VIQGRYRAGLALKPFAELLARDFDGDSTAQAGIYRPKNLPHSAFAEFAFDAVGSQVSSHGGCSDGCILQKFGGIQDGGPIQQFASGALLEQRFYFAAQLGIGSGQQSGALLRAGLTHRVV